MSKKKRPTVKLCVLKGGMEPKRQTDGAVGFDVHARAIVSPHEMERNKKGKPKKLRKTLFDFFNMPDDLNVASHVELLPLHGLNPNGTVMDNKFQLAWRLDPHESCLVGVGFAVNMPIELFQWLAGRSGLSSKYLVNLGNAPGTVDSDYRGEAGLVVVNEGSTPIYITHGMRIGQMLYQNVVEVKIEKVKSLKELGETDRGSKGFGSTGTKANETKPKKKSKK